MHKQYIPSLLPKQTMHQGYMNVWCVSLACVFIQSAGYVNPPEASILNTILPARCDSSHMSSKTEVRSQTAHAALGKNSRSMKVPSSDHALICFPGDDIASSTAGNR